MKALPPGTKARVFGAALVALCLLVILFSELLGFALDRFYLALLGLGVSLFGYGSLRRRRGPAPVVTSAITIGAPGEDPSAEGRR